MKSDSAGVLYFSTPLLNIASIDGSRVSNDFWIVFKLQINIPEFQQKSPLAINWFAFSKFGFSVKVFTGLISESELECTELKGNYIFLRNEINQNKSSRLKNSISSKDALVMTDQEILEMIEIVKKNSYLNEYY